MTRTVAGWLASALLLAAVPALADHEIFFRYTVIGYVKDAAGRPGAGLRLELIRDKTGFSYIGDTDEEGMYVIVARLGDESAGEPLTLRAGSTTVRVIARFDPTNHVDERGTRVDVEGGRVVERAAWFRSTLANFMGAAGR